MCGCISAGIEKRSFSVRDIDGIEYKGVPSGEVLGHGDFVIATCWEQLDSFLLTVKVEEVVVLVDVRSGLGRRGPRAHVGPQGGRWGLLRGACRGPVSVDVQRHAAGGARGVLLQPGAQAGAATHGVISTTLTMSSDINSLSQRFSGVRKC